ncbi:hypothetical protein HPB52_007510 [Rhipicephalus sanguineus]|uniref:HTH CENPB-type domain-containing protein n=1 Tax=Rhipicephalus sanguineus TaxID=34632 RepID=A0A9D4PLV8_RHISA|nr:hypothetical protein HPB52_007510 [Rhipicephalus sanguineus]
MGRDASAKRFDVSLKLKVLAYYDQVRNKYKAAKMFGVSECSVRNWIKEEHRLRALSSQGGSNGVRKTPNRAAETRALFEACLERYVQDCQQRGVKARYRDLLAHAAQLKKVHGVRGLKLSIDWVARFVRERKLVGKCERLPKHAGTASPANNSAGSAAARKKGVPPAASCGSRCAKGLPPAKHNAARSLVKRAMGQLSSKAGKTTSPTTAKRKAPTTAHTKAKLKSKAVSSKASKGSDGKVTKALSKNKPTKKATKTGSELKKTVLTKLPSKYPIWTPVRTSTIHDPCSSQSGNPWRTSPRAREEHIITDRFTQSKSPEDAVFAEKFHKASLKSEAALSPGESPITPEQLAVVRKLFPPIGSLTFPSQRRAPDSQVTFNEPLKASERSLRPRTSEQTQRLSLCFRKRHYQKRKRTLSEPSRSPERRPNGPSVSDIDWLSADGFPSSAKKSCPGGSSPVYSFGETRHCFRKEHFEDSACPPHMPTSGICGNSPRTAVCTPSNDRPASCLFDSAKHVGRAMPASPKATSSSEGKDLFFGQANRLATLRKKQDRNEPVMHNAKGHQD